MFEYMILACVLAGDPQGVECKPIAGPFYDHNDCIEELVKQVTTTGTAICRVRYMEEIFDATETRKRPGNDQREHIRT